MEYKCHFAFFPKQVRLRRGHQGPAPAHLPPANGGQRVHQRRERRKRKRRQQETQAAAAAKLGRRRRRRRRRRERHQGELSSDELFVHSVRTTSHTCMNVPQSSGICLSRVRFWEEADGGLLYCACAPHMQYGRRRPLIIA